MKTGGDAKAVTAEKDKQFAGDDQTGHVFELVREDKVATAFAAVSATYLLSALAFLLWLLFDTWTGQNRLLHYYGYDGSKFASPTFRLLAYVAIGGAMGSTVDGVRSIVSWHSERQAYGPRFIWKDLSLPLVGAAVALIVYATVRGGAGVISGDFTVGKGGAMSTLAAFAMASLAGFSSFQVFRWFDAQANKVFKVLKEGEAIAPSLAGKTVREAKAALKAANLVLGTTTPAGADPAVAKITDQTPVAGSTLGVGDAVNVTVEVGKATAAPSNPSS